MFEENKKVKYIIFFEVLIQVKRPIWCVPAWFEVVLVFGTPGQRIRPPHDNLVLRAESDMSSDAFLLFFSKLLVRRARVGAILELPFCPSKQERFFNVYKIYLITYTKRWTNTYP